MTPVVTRRSARTPARHESRVLRWLDPLPESLGWSDCFAEPWSDDPSRPFHHRRQLDRQYPAEAGSLSAAGQRSALDPLHSAHRPDTQGEITTLQASTRGHARR